MFCRNRSMTRAVALILAAAFILLCIPNVAFAATTTETQAIEAATTYLSIKPFSKEKLISQLLYDEYTEEEAKYGVENCGADWHEQAAKTAEAKLKLKEFSKQGLINQLLYEEFTQEEAEYGAGVALGEIEPVGPAWRQVDDKWKYQNADGSFVIGRWRLIDGAWYYFDSSGIMATGWEYINGAWYYFGDAGAMQTGWQKIGSTWYYFSNSGAMSTGWRKVDEKWYFFSGSGAMYTGWLQSGGAWYYLNSSGEMASNEYVSGYWINADGTWTYQHRASWNKSGDRWWYGDTSGWYAVKATYKIDGAIHGFDSDGWWISKVYWVPGGEVYHVSERCSTLKNARQILNGTVEESGKTRICEVCGK
ncbi:MAG: Ltp family lipoprotein [Firmicutes bacterium]|nr:Ltp family lipoprotein [Bacillota bacterium]